MIILAGKTNYFILLDIKMVKKYYLFDFVTKKWNYRIENID